MNISHICVNFGNPMYHDLFGALSKADVDQSVFYPRSKKHQLSKFDEPYEVDSPLILNLLSRISFPRKRRLMRREYMSLYQRQKPELIHAHTFFSDGSLANYHYKKNGIPFIVAFRSTDFEYFLKYKPWLKNYGKQIVNNAKFIIFISPSLKKKISTSLWRSI